MSSLQPQSVAISEVERACANEPTIAPPTDLEAGAPVETPLTSFTRCHLGIVTQLEGTARLPELVDAANQARQMALTTLDLPAPSDKVERALMEHPVARLQPKPPITVSPDTSVQDVIQIMLDRNIGAVLVVDGQNKLLGIFSERDLLKKIAGLHESFSHLKVGDFMTPDPVTVTLRDPMNYGAAAERTDVSGGGLLDMDKKALRKDMDNVLSP